MPDFPIVDTHLHLWDPPAGHISYPWLRHSLALNRRFVLEEFRSACGPVQVERMVFLECGAAEEHHGREAEWVTSLARVDRRIQGIVAGAAIEKGEGIRSHLEHLAANRLVKGVRRMLQGEGDREFCLRPEFLKGVQLLPQYGLSFDICIVEGQMPAVVRMVQACPDVMFILDHIGKPKVKEQVFEPWRKDVKALSRLGNVWCKVSGVATEADHTRWTIGDVKPYIDHVIECFGFGRCMFGGDWPVATLATDYPRWVETLEAAVSGCSDAERRNLFRDNAVEFYRLDKD